MLHEFLTSKRDAIIARARTRVSASSAPTATDAELAHGVPVFVDQLVATLKHSERSRNEMIESATQHGSEMLRMGYTVAQVVYDYGNVCQAVTELAVEQNATITINEFRILNRCLDDAIAQAVTEYGRLREQSLSAKGGQRLRALSHELRNRLGAAMLSFGLIKSGEVAIGSSAGVLLDRSLKDLNDLISRSLAQGRSESTAPKDEMLAIAELLEAIEPASVASSAEGPAG